MTYYDNKLDYQVSDTFLLSRGPQTRALHKVGYEVIEIADDEGESKPIGQLQPIIRREFDQNSIASFNVHDIINGNKAIDVEMEEGSEFSDDDEEDDGPPTILLSSSLTNFEDNDTVCSDITSEDVFDDESEYEKSYDGIVSIDEDEIDHARSNQNIPKYLDVCFVPLHQQEYSQEDMPCNGDEISFEGRQFYFVDCDIDADDMELDGMELSLLVDETQRPSNIFQSKTNPDIIVIDDDDDVWSKRCLLALIL